MASPRALCRTPSRCVPNSANPNAPRFASGPIAPLTARLSFRQEHWQPLHACTDDSAARAQLTLVERCAPANAAEAECKVIGPVLGRRQLLLSAGGSAIWTVGCPRPANAAGEASGPDDEAVSFPVALLDLTVPHVVHPSRAADRTSTQMPSLDRSADARYATGHTACSTWSTPAQRGSDAAQGTTTWEQLSLDRKRRCRRR